MSVCYAHYRYVYLTFINDDRVTFREKADMSFDPFTLVRCLHVVAIVGWIGGVWFVTFVVMPAIARSEAPANRLAAFHRIEQGFAPQAKLWVLLAGASGFWMTHQANLWSRFADPGYWWMQAMLVLWTIFAVMLFVAEPLVLHRRMAASPSPEADFAKMVVAHRVLSLAALVTVLGAMAGAHGLL
jgi:uncharacterized membrane protein